MIIQRRYQIEVCVAKDDMRPVLTYVNVGTFCGQDVAMAADGFHLAVVPVELEEDDVPGPVPASIFRQARAWALKRDYQLSFGLGAARINFANGWSAPRLEADIGTFPDITKAIEGALQEQEQASRFGIDPRRLNRLQTALGSASLGGSGLVLHWTTTKNPILAWPLDAEPDSEHLKAPFGVVMPMYTHSLESPTRPIAKTAA